MKRDLSRRFDLSWKRRYDIVSPTSEIAMHEGYTPQETEVFKHFFSRHGGYVDTYEIPAPCKCDGERVCYKHYMQGLRDKYAGMDGYKQRFDGQMTLFEVVA